LPGPDVLLSLTAVENLAEACLAALGWQPGAYNIADAAPYSRDAVVEAVLGVPVRHVPSALARLSPTLTRYALDQLTDGLVLDTARAAGQGWRPGRSLADFLTAQVV
jgi:hypothetical protein